MTTLPLTQTRR